MRFGDFLDEWRVPATGPRSLRPLTARPPETGGHPTRARKKGSGRRAGARELCEDFAPPDGTTRPSGEGGANRARKKAAGAQWERGNCVKNLLPVTELQGLARRGEQTAPGKRRRASNQKGVDSAGARNPLPSFPTFSLPPAFSPSVPSPNPNPSADAADQSNPPARPSWNPMF